MYLLVEHFEQKLSVLGASDTGTMKDGKGSVKGGRRLETELLITCSTCCDETRIGTPEDSGRLNVRRGLRSACPEQVEWISRGIFSSFHESPPFL